jgi:hypothetical protein
MKQDFTLTIEQVSKRLNKSVRTIHRYKNSGKLSFVIGETQGNPLYFSVSEVEALARELYPQLAPAAPAAEPFWERLERIEQVLAMFQQNPLFERLLSASGAAGDTASRGHLVEALERLAALQRGEAVDRRELGTLLISVGNSLIASADEPVPAPPSAADS